MILSKDNLFFKLIGYVFLLIPAFLILGPFFSDLAVILINILFLFYLIKNKKIDTFKNKYFYFFLIFYTSLIFSSLFSSDMSYSLKKSIPYIRFGIFILAVSYFLNNYSDLKRFINIKFNILILIILFLFIDSTYQFFFHKNIFGISIDDTKRVSSLFGDELILGSFVSKIGMVLIGILFFLEKNKYFFFFTIFFCFLLIIYSGERAAFFLFSFFNIILFFKFRLYKKKLNIILILLGLLILIPSLMSKYSFERLFVKTFNQALSQEYGLVVFTPTHHELYRTGLNIFKNNIIFGSGLKTFRNECKKEKYRKKIIGCSTHPHNYYIQILSETGLISFILFGLFYLYISIYIVKNFNKLKTHKEENFMFILYLTLFVYFFPLTPTGSFFNNWNSVIIYYPIGILMGIKTIYLKNEKIYY